MSIQTNGSWQSTGPFSHQWPDGSVEHYQSGYHAVCTAAGQQRRVVLGFTTREAAGMKDRHRVVVFFGQIQKSLFPVVEFVGANDFSTTGVLVSVVKHASRKHLRPGEAIPGSYQSM